MHSKKFYWNSISITFKIIFQNKEFVIKYNQYIIWEEYECLHTYSNHTQNHTHTHTHTHMNVSTLIPIKWMCIQNNENIFILFLLKIYFNKRDVHSKWYAYIHTFSIEVYMSIKGMYIQNDMRIFILFLLKIYFNKMDVNVSTLIPEMNVSTLIPIKWMCIQNNERIFILFILKIYFNRRDVHSKCIYSSRVNVYSKWWAYIQNNHTFVLVLLEHVFH